MAGHADGGLKDALALDQAARDLETGSAAAAETGAADADAGQLGLFASSHPLGELKRPGGEIVRAGPGRPRGSLNRSTRDLVKLITARGKHPLLGLAEIVATPVDVLAATLGCKRIEAAEYQRKCRADLLPYVSQKLPTAIQIEGGNAGMLVINLGGALGEAAKGLDMKLIDAVPEAEENQSLSEDDAAQSHGDASHDEAK